MKRIFFLLLILAVAGGAMILKTQAGTNESGRGWLWGGSENPSDGILNGNESGFGWISFNNTDAAGAAVNGAVSYGVNIPLADGTLSGYAWSEHYGWISFNGADLAGCTPVLSAAARTGDAIVGGARILSIKTESGKSPSNSGGFDGCISLSGTGYGVTVSGASLAGYAWSSDLGWIDFSRATLVSAPAYKICPRGLSLDLTTQRTGQLRLYKRADGKAIEDCGSTSGSTDITSDAATAWSSSVPGIATVDNAGSKGLVASVSGGSAEVSVRDNGVLADAVPISVTTCAASSCSTLPPSVTDQYCPGEPFNADNNCGGTLTGCTTGTRSCDYNWKEVAP